MLILTRHKNETIVIDDTIKVTVIEILSRNRVRLGIEAPLGKHVDRMERWEELHGQAHPYADSIKHSLAQPSPRPH